MANALIKAMHQMSAYVCAHMYHAYIYVSREEERKGTMWG